MTTPGHSRSTGSDPRHVPVLVDEVVSILAPAPGRVYVDCTVGLGGHTAALLAAGAGRVIAVDRDEGALNYTRAHLAAGGERVEFVHADYRELASVLHTRGVTAVAGVLVFLVCGRLAIKRLEVEELEIGRLTVREGLPPRES